MPFRNYQGVFDAPTLEGLQDVFEAIWAFVAANRLSTSREELAQIVVGAHSHGLVLNRIPEHVLQVVITIDRQIAAKTD